MLRLIVLASLVDVLLVGCVSTPPPVMEGNVPTDILSAKYRDKPDIKAYAKSPTGRSWMSWNFCTVEDAVARARSGCEKNHGGPCEIIYIGPNRVDDQSETARRKLSASYVSEVRRRAAERPFTPLGSVSYAALTRRAGATPIVTTGAMHFDPRDICRGTLEGKIGDRQCRGQWVNKGREQPDSSFPLRGDVTMQCDGGSTLSGAFRLIRKVAGRINMVGSDGSVVRVVISDRADFSGLSTKNFELLWRALD